jgi:hypothetical protein
LVLLLFWVRFAHSSLPIPCELSTPSSEPYPLLQQQRLALENLLVRAWSVAAWKNQTFWGSASHSVCCWFGLTCSSSSRAASGTLAITSIQLPKNNIGTVLPDDLFSSLFTLTSVDLSVRVDFFPFSCCFLIALCFLLYFLFRRVMASQVPFLRQFAFRFFNPSF